MPSIPIQRISPHAVIPTRANPTDAGYDLYALEGGVLMPGQRDLVRTGIAVAIPAPYYGRIAPRSGLAVKSGIDVMAGVIDPTYRGELKVVLINLSSETFYWPAGARIAQLIIERYHDVDWIETEQLEATARGAGGFGSSGT